MLELKWAKGLITLALIFLFILPCRADDSLLSHVTLRRYPEGSFRVRYGGLRGLAIDQIVGQSYSLYDDWLEIKYFNDPIAISKEMIWMRDLQRDIDNGGAWFNRRWWESFPESQGGAPENPIYSHRGPKNHIIDMGLIYLTHDFKIRLREYEAQLYNPFTSSSPGFNLKYTPKSRWNFRFRPRARFSTRTLLRRVSVELIFRYTRLNTPIADVSFVALYSIRLRDFRVEILISLLQW